MGTTHTINLNDENYEKLEKAVSTRQAMNEQRQFNDIYLRQRKDETTKAVHLVFQSMLDEIERVITE